MDTIYIILLCIYFYINGILAEQSSNNKVEYILYSLFGTVHAIAIIIWTLIWYGIAQWINQYTAIITIFRFYVLRQHRDYTADEITNIFSNLDAAISNIFKGNEKHISVRLHRWIYNKIKEANI